MEQLPPFFAIPRPGYLKHKYLIVVENKASLIDGERWDLLSCIDCAGSIRKIPVTQVNKEWKRSRVKMLHANPNPGTLSGLHSGSSFRILPYEFILAPTQRAIPIVYFHSTGFLPGTVRASRKLLLAPVDIVEIRQTLISLGIYNSPPGSSDDVEPIAPPTPPTPSHPLALVSSKILEDELLAIRISIDSKIADRRLERQKIYKEGCDALTNKNYDAYIRANNALKDILKQEENRVGSGTPSFVLHGYVQSELDKSSECPILGIELAECESITLLSCYHLFDSVSFLKWKETKNCCPTCRTVNPVELLKTKGKEKNKIC